MPTAAALRAQVLLGAAPSAPVPQAARGLNPSALRLLPRRPRTSTSKREDHPGTDSNELYPCTTSLPRPAAPGEGGARGSLLLGLGPAPAATHASRAALLRPGPPPRTVAQEKEGPPESVSEEAGRAARAGAGRPRPGPAPLAFAKLEGSAGVRGRLRSGGRPGR